MNKTTKPWLDSPTAALRYRTLTKQDNRAVTRQPSGGINIPCRDKTRHHLVNLCEGEELNNLHLPMRSHRYIYIVLNNLANWCLEQNLAKCSNVKNGTLCSNPWDVTDIFTIVWICWVISLSCIIQQNLANVKNSTVCTKPWDVTYIFTSFWK